MGGTTSGGLAAAAKNKAKDPDFYKKLALKAQKSWRENGRTPRGFSINRELASKVGKIGGAVSRRTGVKNGSKTSKQEN